MLFSIFFKEYLFYTVHAAMGDTQQNKHWKEDWYQKISAGRSVYKCPIQKCLMSPWNIILYFTYMVLVGSGILDKGC